MHRLHPTPAPLIGLLLAAAALLAHSPPATANACTVPGSHPTLEAAVADPGCGDIELASQVYTEVVEIDRPLALSGPAENWSFIDGQVAVTTGGAPVALSALRIQGSCSGGSLQVTGGAQVTADGIEVTWSPTGPCGSGLIFRDSFED